MAYLLLRPKGNGLWTVIAIREKVDQFPTEPPGNARVLHMSADEMKRIQTNGWTDEEVEKHNDVTKAVRKLVRERNAIAGALATATAEID